MPRSWSEYRSVSKAAKVAMACTVCIGVIVLLALGVQRLLGF